MMYIVLMSKSILVILYFLLLTTIIKNVTLMLTCLEKEI